MHSITKDFGRADVNRTLTNVEKADIKRILICRPNHRLGNLLLITPLLQEVTSTFPQSKVDLFVKGELGLTLFKNYSNVDRIIELPRKPFKQLLKYIQVWVYFRAFQYDIVINVDKNSSSGRIATRFSNAKHKFFGDGSLDNQVTYSDHEHIAKYPIYNLRSYLKSLGIFNTSSAIPRLDLKLQPFEVIEGRKILSGIVKNDRRTICIFTYATGEKCYSENWWDEFYQRLKKEYHEYNIIEVLPAENISKISFKAPTFYSKDVREIGSVMANTDLFIGADSGIMHLASSVDLTTIGLFSITDPKIYQPYNGNSVGINTNILTLEECIEIINTALLQKNLSSKIPLTGR